jgi:hypothetical protein
MTAHGQIAALKRLSVDAAVVVVIEAGLISPVVV